MRIYRVKFYFVISVIAVVFSYHSEARAEDLPSPTLTPEEKRIERSLVRKIRKNERKLDDEDKQIERRFIQAERRYERKLKEEKAKTENTNTKLGDEIKTGGDDYKAKEKLQENFNSSPRKKEGTEESRKNINEELDVKTDYTAADKFLRNWNSGKSNNLAADTKCREKGKFVSVHYESGDASLCLPRDVDGQTNWSVPKPTKGTETSIQICNLSTALPKMKAVMPSPALIFYEDDNCETLTQIDISERNIGSGKCKSLSYDKPFKILYSGSAAACAVANPANNTKKEKDAWESEVYKDSDKAPTPTPVQSEGVN